MQSNELSFQSDSYDAGLVMKSDHGAHRQITTKYTVECFDKDGNLKWKEEFNNLITTEGLNDSLDKYFKGSSYTAAWYLGLVSGATPTFAAGDTLASHAGWTEFTSYTGNRLAITFGTASAGSLAASSAVSFPITGSGTVGGAFISSVATGTSGVLYSEGDFTTDRSVVNGDTLNVTPTCTASSA